MNVFIYICVQVLKYFTLLRYTDNVSNFLTATSTTVCDCLQNKQKIQQTKKKKYKNKHVNF